MTSHPLKSVLLSCLVLSAAVTSCCAQTMLQPWQIDYVAHFAAPPAQPSTNVFYLFTDAAGTGVCSGGGSAYALCVWNGSAFVQLAATATGLGDPGSNSVPYRNAPGATIPATATELSSQHACVDTGSTDAYACTLSPAIVSYTAGTIYWFKANTGNTGAATINFNGLGPLVIKKRQGGFTVNLSDNDIGSGQWVAVIYDGTNAQMASQLGNSGLNGGFCDTAVVTSIQAITGTPGCSVVTSPMTAGTFPANPHALLSSTHSDTVASTPTNGGIIYGNSTPKWQQLNGNGTPNRMFLTEASLTPSWTALQASDIPAALSATTSVNGTPISASKTILYTDSSAGSFPTLNQSTLGNAATATALATAPSTCSAGQAPTGVNTLGQSQNCTAYVQVATDIGGSASAPHVVATHLSAALPRNQGGLGTAVSATGFLRDGVSSVTGGELSGDITTSGSFATTLATVNSGPGACGDSTHVCQVTTDGKGRVTAQSTVSILTGGTVTAAAQYAIPYYSLAGTASTLAGASFNGILQESTSGAPTAATSHNLASPLRCADSSGSQTNKLCTTTPSFTPQLGDMIVFTSTTAADPGVQLNVNTNGYAGILLRNGSTSAPTSSIGTEPSLLMFDGTNWVYVTNYYGPISIFQYSGPTITDSGDLDFEPINTRAGSVTFNLPAISTSGLKRCIRNHTGVTAAITVAVASGNYIDLNGAAGTVSTGTLVSGGALGDQVCLISEIAFPNNIWYATAARGTWTNN